MFSKPIYLQRKVAVKGSDIYFSPFYFSLPPVSKPRFQFSCNFFAVWKGAIKGKRLGTYIYLQWKLRWKSMILYKCFIFHCSWFKTRLSSFSQLFCRAKGDVKDESLTAWERKTASVYNILPFVRNSHRKYICVQSFQFSLPLSTLWET